jgi:hypothetical protein
MSSNLSVLVPVSLVDSAPPIDAVRLSDGRFSIGIRSLCRMVDIALNKQIARIRRSPTLAPALLVTLVDMPGGPQQMDVLLLWAVPLWANGLHISRLPERKQGAARVLQQEAVAAVERALSQPAQAPEQDPPARSSEVPPGDSDQIRQELSSLVEHLDIKQAILLLIRWLSALEAEQQNQHSHIERLIALEAEWQEERHQLAQKQEEQQVRLVDLEQGAADIDKRLLLIEQAFKDHIRPVETFPGLPLERIGHLYVLTRWLRRQQGMPLAESLAALAAEFHVPDVTDLPETAWPDILAWFHQRLQND